MPSWEVRGLKHNLEICSLRNALDPAAPCRWPEKEGLAIIKLARQHFNTEQMPALLDKGSIRLGQQHFQNDVYSKAGSSQSAVCTLQSRCRQPHAILSCCSSVLRCQRAQLTSLWM